MKVSNHVEGKKIKIGNHVEEAHSTVISAGKGKARHCPPPAKFLGKMKNKF
jgi:hypothetical protein